MNKFLIGFISSFFLSIVLLQAQKEIVVENKNNLPLYDNMVEIQVSDLKLPLGEYIITFPNGGIAPLELSSNLKGDIVAIFPIDTLLPQQKLNVKIQPGSANSYPKRAYAELAHKIGGRFEKQDEKKKFRIEYVDGFSWVKPNQMTVPGSFEDHSYYIKYEGPGWENDRVAFRFYLDNRNAIDVFGKRTTGIVLPTVGVDGYDNYHNLSFWGMDNLKVGKALGLGSIAIWDGEKVVRVDEKDSTTCFIQTDSKLRSQVNTTYYGWNANGVKCNLKSLITLDAGSRASHMELKSDKNVDSFATGIIKNKNVEFIVNNDKNNEWSYIATFGQQSLNKDMQGLVLFARTTQIQKITEDALNYVVVLQPDNGYADYYFMPTWELDPEPVKTKEQFIEKINEVLNRLNNPLLVTLKR